MFFKEFLELNNANIKHTWQIISVLMLHCFNDLISNNGVYLILCYREKKVKKQKGVKVKMKLKKKEEKKALFARQGIYKQKKNYKLWIEILQSILYLLKKLFLSIQFVIYCHHIQCCVYLHMTNVKFLSL